MPNTGDWLSAVADFVRQVVAEQATPESSSFCTATWVSSETVDSNLSQVRFADGTVARGVPKAKGLTFTANDTVVCISPKGTMPLFIIAIWSGDVTLYRSP